MRRFPMSDIWHDVCTTCHPEMDRAICGLEIDFNPDEGTIDIPDGQDCVVCTGMICVTCPPDEIVGTIG